VDPNGVDGLIEYTLESPNYPGKYANNLDCLWTFTNVAGGDMKVFVDDIQIEAAKNCKKDYLLVKEVKKFTKVKYCGTSVASKQSKLTSTTSSLVVKFITNGKTKKNGFSIRIQARQPSRRLKDKYQVSSSSSISLFPKLNGTYFEPSFMMESKSRK